MSRTLDDFRSDDQTEGAQNNHRVGMGWARQGAQSNHGVGTAGCQASELTTWGVSLSCQSGTRGLEAGPRASELR